MAKERTYLPAGTQVCFDSGNRYLITGAPIGFGGGSILYPARRAQDGTADDICYVLKECYPVSTGRSFCRDSRGEIVPESGSEEEMQFLRRAKVLQLAEETVSRRIYRTASRMLPIRDSSQSVSFSGNYPATTGVQNTYTVLDSLAQKGRSLTDWVAEHRRFTAAETLRIIQQLLFALREVHLAGFLHLDIQDGNVFLRGTLRDKDELVTLIDFGCARELIDGKTAPIRDKVIFTTQGFFAPETILHNDGNLQLGPEADIYSVGCVALFLLTGRRADVRGLMEIRTGNYLPPNQLRRCKCPKHLVDSLQRVLAKALAREPENRYHCADAMLEDVTELVDALQPYRSDLRSQRYDAFVCYKHGTVDSAAALVLQQALENYRAPKGVAGKRKPFTRVFVDEGELSSCADFGQQIQDALKNSGWLIVICSPDTPMSPWVQKEIDTFLEYHDRSRILALLTDGSPDQSFPPQLKGNGTGEGEVFAAHAMGRTAREVTKKLRGDSLLKLVAPMLGTTYDTLKQRHKVYQLQRIAAVTAGFLLAAMGFGAYALNRANVIAQQAVRIEEEYERALVNESLFLAQQAEQRLAANDPLSAMELALKALPSESQERPLLTEVEYVLGKALGVYTTPSSTENTATPVGIIDTDCENYFLSQDGSNLFAWDSTGVDISSVIECWDANSLSQRWVISVDERISSQPILTSDGAMFLNSSSRIYKYSSETGELYWTIDLTALKETENVQEILTTFSTISLSADESELLVIYGDEGDLWSDSSVQNVPHEQVVLVFSGQTGEILRSTPFRMDGDQWITGDIFVSPDLHYAAILSENETFQYDLYSHHYLHLVDLQTGQHTQLFDDEAQVLCAKFVDGRLAVIRAAGYTMVTEHNTYYQYNSPYACQLEIYDPSKSRLIWRYEFMEYLETGGIDTILPTTYPDGTSNDSGLLFVIDDHCMLLDLESGELIRQYVLPAAAASVSLTTKGFDALLTDGTYVYTGFGIDTLVQVPNLDGTVSAACKTEDAYYIQSSTRTNRSNRIYKYQLNWFDDTYQQHFVTDSDSWKGLQSNSLTDRSWAILVDDNRVCFLDLKRSEHQAYSIPEQYEFSEYRICAASHNGQRLYWTGTSRWDDSTDWITHGPLYVFDSASGSLTRLTQPPQPHPYMNVSDTVIYNDTLLIVATWSENMQDYLSVYSWDLATGTLDELWQDTLTETSIVHEGNGLWQQERYVSDSLSVSPEQHRLTFATCDLYSCKSIKLASLDLETGKTTAIPLDIPCNEDSYELWKSECYQWNYDCTQAVFSYSGHIMVADLDGNILCSILPEEEIVSVEYTPDEQHLLTVSDGGLISKYRIADASCVASINISEYRSAATYITEDNWNCNFLDQTTLLAITDSTGFLIDATQDQLKMKAVLEQCIGYDPSTDRFLIAETNSYSGNNITFGSFPRYTVEDLIRKATSILNK